MAAVQVVEFDADSGAMALDRWNLFHCGVFRYSCALENISKLEITEVHACDTVAAVFVRDVHAPHPTRARTVARTTPVFLIF